MLQKIDVACFLMSVVILFGLLVKESRNDGYSKYLLHINFVKLISKKNLRPIRAKKVVAQKRVVCWNNFRQAQSPTSRPSCYYYYKESGIKRLM